MKRDYAKTDFIKRAARSRSAKFLSPKAFQRDEDGAILILALYLFVFMIMVGGIALDFMRFEQRRVALQNTLDRATLAATGLSQQLPAEEVVRDYFDKEGLSEYLTSVTVNQGMNFRDVTATAEMTMDTFLMSRLGIYSLDIPADSSALQRITNIEISLVLDISGSMGSNNRLVNLQPAAREFIDTVLSAAAPGRVTLSIIPYNAQVNLGPDLMAQYNVREVQDTSFCVQLPDSVFTTTALPNTTRLDQNPHMDPYYDRAYQVIPHCPPEEGNRAMAISNDADALKGRINSLTARGSTSIDVGVKWGVALLDEGTRPVTAGLIRDHVVSSDYANRPGDMNDPEVMKFLIVMTDGENTQEYTMAAPQNTDQLSNVWRDPTTGALSVRHASRPGPNKFYWPASYDAQGRRVAAGWRNRPNPNLQDAVQQSWPQLWDQYSVRYISRVLFDIPLGNSSYTYFWSFMEEIRAIKDQRLQQICSAARASGIIIYGIGFEAPANGRDQLRACATSPSHYFDANGLEISTAFRAIAGNITQLRLTQ